MIKIGFIGAGRMGTIHAMNALENQECRVSGIYDVALEAARVLGEKVGAPVVDRVETLLSDVDGVVVTTPTRTHVSYIKMAVERGVPVLVEKPITFSAREIDEVLSWSPSQRDLVMPAYMRRFDRDYRQVYDIVRTGALGKILSIVAISRDQYPPSPYFVPDSGGLFFDMGIHDYDLILWLTNDEVSVVKTVSCGLWRNEYMRRLGDPEEGAVMLRMSRGAIALVLLSRSIGLGYDIRMRIVGTKGSVDVRAHVKNQLVTYSRHGIVRHLETFPERFGEAYKEELRAFVDAVRKRQRFPVSVTDVLRAEQLAYATSNAWLAEGSSAGTGEGEIRG
ncbi:MAG: Gfo/Idh/MocA family oxidoreductase [Firmicutes bacterium]|nr:Gfo/Idh/MocA family oxidoreductase [Bacillota bacterium]